MPTRARVPAILAVSVAIVAAGCSAPPQRAPDAELVPCALNEVANAVLRHVIEDCASSHGDWARDLGPGCPRVWAAQLGLVAGRRRQREDLLELAKTTIDRQRSDLDGLILSSLFGDLDAEGPSAYGVPALLISGVLDGSASDYRRFRLAFDRALAELDTERLPDTRLAGLAALLAELARVDAESSEELLDRARSLAPRLRSLEYRALVRAAIAKASASPADLATARESLEAALPSFRLEKGSLRPVLEGDLVLSKELALVHALADLAQLGGLPGDRSRAEALLAAIFSAPLFDGRVLAHDAHSDGRRSSDYCSGCNLEAVYLVDRLWGDTFKVAPLPELPRRPDPWLEPRDEVHPLFAVHSGQSGTYGGWDFGVTVGFEELPRSSEHPRGALRLDFRLSDTTQRCVLARQGDDAALLQLGADDRASYAVPPADLASGEYDPERCRYTFELGPSRNGHREIRLRTTRLVEVTGSGV